MHVTPSLPSLRRVPPGAWVALAWCASTVFTFLARIRLPGQSGPNELPAAQLYRWDGMLFLTVACVLALAGSARLGRRPLTALSLLLAAGALLTVNLAVGAIQLAQYLAVDVALYFIAATRPRRTGAVGLAMALALLVAWLSVRLSRGWGIGTLVELTVALTVVVSWLLGDATHRTRVHAEQLRTRAADQAVTDERLRIAREMHDMVAHSIGIIALQAGAAARVVHTQPDAAREAMTAVETAGRETLAGLRRMLVALREADHGDQEARTDGPGDGGAVDPRDRSPEHGSAETALPAAPGEGGTGTARAVPPGPAEGLADLDRLAAAATAAGVRVDVHWTGERRRLPPDIDLSAFRIVQESVTNVLRHAATTVCRVTVDHRDTEVAVEITDDGRGGGSGTDTGFGLIGMRERAALLHGEFTAGPRPEGGFRVSARLPIPATGGAGAR
ncbi:sensor histidine kinase [Streptomyces triticiradicis]|uniref:histidine kinase n=1 Tax=Streptomyces triticiradicis TaxID=2651189 RepID=A0A7J5DLX2_9ACTN|nr:histidine kinase [Streptomyces triticiradicis]KAB1989714.1 sensor histidine kinase [Streptomyces triticiradicis]